MINLHFFVSHPSLNAFRIVRTWTGCMPWPNWFWDAQVNRNNDIVSLGLAVTWGQDHPGVSVSVSVLTWQFEINCYDHRHWTSAYQ